MELLSAGKMGVGKISKGGLQVARDVKGRKELRNEVGLGSSYIGRRRAAIPESTAGSESPVSVGSGLSLRFVLGVGCS